MAPFTKNQYGRSFKLGTGAGSGSCKMIFNMLKISRGQEMTDDQKQIAGLCCLAASLGGMLGAAGASFLWVLVALSRGWL